MKGKVVSWKNDKGFGFISTSDHNETIFFHISSVKKAIRKPEVGDRVTFEATKDSQGRLKATHVLLEDVVLASHNSTNHIITEPVKKDWLDCFLYICLTLSFTISIFLFIKEDKFHFPLTTSVIFLASLFFLSNRKKQPKNKLFSCAKCRLTSNHDTRTIQAWNNGFNRLYCKTCHQKWLSEQPKEHKDDKIYSSSSKSGCLGMIAIMIFIPIFFFI
jgi:cold shock CspA family protein